jgi:hypothetical protein
MAKVKGRAYTYEDRREIVDKALGAWMCKPSLRFGQLIVNAITENLVCNGVKPTKENIETKIFYIEDEALAQVLTDYITRKIND